MPPDCLSSEGERRCRRLLAGATARLRARPAAAAVLVPLCSVRGVPALLYTLRSSRLAGRHKGDVSFPGGKCDRTDQDVVHTALRETREELGLTVPEERVWGILQPVYDQQKTTVVPVLAGVGPLDPQSLRPNPEEVSGGGAARSNQGGLQEQVPCLPSPCLPPTGGRGVCATPGPPAAGAEPRLHPLLPAWPLPLHTARLPARATPCLGPHGHHHRAHPAAAGARGLPAPPGPPWEVHGLKAWP
uniref:Nudix hydrolase domain-containing protein n=1 Tax=Suricata suricatta TaxID=37032 RepID=A0A673TAE8_SURSU